MIDFFKKIFGTKADMAIIVAVLGILAVLFFPIPKGLLDFLLITNLSLALLIFLLTFYSEKPLSFSTFPSLLLIATLFRLALNVAATRLILTDADAGKVISTIGAYVVGGNYVIGLVVFLILVVVQYVVVTSGAQRVAEVAARFTLDAMPGKQMSIDAEMNMGLIDENEARKRRSAIEKEANFYGAMDGASKFVKGDAVAGIIILLINIIGGLAIGLLQKGMSWGEALHIYTLLTIGDGIVTQIPALIISTATGIIVTRAATDAQLSEEIVKQVAQHPKSLVIVGLGLTGALLLPGIPVFPVLILLAITGTLIYFAFRAAPPTTGPEDVQKSPQQIGTSDIQDLLRVDPIEVYVGENLKAVVGLDEGPFMRRVQATRRQLALDLGFLFPQVRLRDLPSGAANEYEIRILGVRTAQGTLESDRILAINPGGERVALEGIATRDPTFRLPAIWIAEKDVEKAKRAGYTTVDPITVVATHFSELIKSHAAELLTRKETEALMGRVRTQQPTLIEELIPNVLTFGEIQRVLQGLLREKVSIRNIELISETLLEQGRHTRDSDQLIELVRERLGNVICDRVITTDGVIHVLTLDAKVEDRLRNSLRQTDKQSMLILEPSMAENLLRRLAHRCEEMMVQNLTPVLLCAPPLRRHLRKLSERVLPHMTILSMAEIPSTKSVKSFAVVETN